MKIKTINKIEYVVLGLRDNYYQPKYCWNEPDFKISVDQMIKRYPETVFKEIIIGPSKKMLQWDLSQALFQQILKTKPKLIEEYNKNKIVNSK